MSVVEERVHFTVSMWNRFGHLELLLDCLSEVYRRDSNIALHVCAFEGSDANLSDFRRVLGAAPYPTYLTYRIDEFGNGLGHNVAAAGVPRDDIVCIMAVDVCIPPDVTEPLRQHLVREKTFYMPVVPQQCRDGRLMSLGPGGALIATYKTDWLRLGGLWPDRAPWGGDTTCSRGEDVSCEEGLLALGLEKIRLEQEGLYCRWHKRWASNPFYRIVRGRKRFVPWFNLFDENGKELGK